MTISEMINCITIPATVWWFLWSILSYLVKPSATREPTIFELLKKTMENNPPVVQTEHYLCVKYGTMQIMKASEPVQIHLFSPTLAQGHLRVDALLTNEEKEQLIQLARKDWQHSLEKKVRTLFAKGTV